MRSTACSREAVLKEDVSGALKTVDSVVTQGSDLSMFVNDLCWYLRNLLLVKSTEDPEAVMEKTEGLEGFISVGTIRADHGSAEVGFIIRDHDKDKFAVKKESLAAAAQVLRERYPRAEISLEISDTYGNIADCIREDNRKCIDYLYQAMEELERQYVKC